VRTPLLIAASILAMIVVALAVALAGGGDEPPAPGPAAGHVHALGLNPADRSLYIATHNGLFRLDRGAQEAERLGDRQQDTMGFTVVGPDHFLGSGHPDLRDDLPPLLGLIQSRDAGQTWTPVSLLGQVDFHALRVQGRRVVGYDATSGGVLISEDGGERWQRRRPPEPLVDLIVDPSSPDVLLAAGERRLHHSRNEGRTWQVREDGTGLLAWPAPGRLYLLDGNGRLWLSPDGGRRWQGRGEIGGRPAALLAVGARELYAATHTDEIKQSHDAGATWTSRTQLSDAVSG
jgi:photosystem II stability/assembly factor-like uncharacterized protein